MKNRIQMLICATVAAAALASAQQPTMLRIGYTKLNPGARPEYEGLSKLVSAAYKKAGLQFREVWTTGVAGEMMFISVAPVQNLAQFDGPSPITTQLSPEDQVRYAQLARSAVRESRFVLAQMVPELSITSEREAAFPLARVSSIVVRPGKYQEFEGLIKEMLIPAWKKAGIKAVHTLRNVAGGPMGGYTLVAFADKYSEIEGWGSTEKLLGPEVYHRFMEGVSSSVDTAENSFARHLTDLSYSSQQRAAYQSRKHSGEQVAQIPVVAEEPRVSVELTPFEQ